MPPAPAKAYCISLAKDDVSATPADADAVNLPPTVNADDAAFEAESVRGRIVLGPTDGAEECI